MFSEKDNYRQRVLSVEEEERLLTESPEPLRTILILLLHTGMRKGELLNLKWQEIDSEKKQVILEQTKSGRRRVIPLNELAWKTLCTLCTLGTEGSNIFPHRNIRKGFLSACKRAGIEGLRMHDLRHTFASRLVAKGVDIVTVKELLGHASIGMTMRYSHSDLTQKVKAVNLLNISRMAEKTIGAPVAQLDRASDYESEGRGFESLQAHSLFP